MCAHVHAVLFTYNPNHNPIPYHTCMCSCYHLEYMHMYMYNHWRSRRTFDLTNVKSQIPVVYVIGSAEFWHVW
jgi:hypothetical protein